MRKTGEKQIDTADGIRFSYPTAKRVGWAVGVSITIVTGLLADIALPALAAAKYWGWFAACAAIVVGGLAYSGPTVYGFMFKMLPDDVVRPFKAAGFVVLMEGTMTLPMPLKWLYLVSIACALYLACINGYCMATYCIKKFVSVAERRKYENEKAKKSIAKTKKVAA